jgi:hypothetical protein
MNDTEKAKAFYREFGAQFPRLAKVALIVSNSVEKYSICIIPKSFSNLFSDFECFWFFFWNRKNVLRNQSNDNSSLPQNLSKNCL